MLFCHVNDVSPGTILGAAVIDIDAPAAPLLKPGVVLNEPLLGTLKKLGVTQIWVQHERTADLDSAVATRAGTLKLDLHNLLKNDLHKFDDKSIAEADIQLYRQALRELDIHLMANRERASLIDQLFTCRPTMFTHAANVTYMAMMVGMDLQDYIARQRQWLASEHARDLTALGLGAMLHDIGKIECGDKPGAYHEVAPKLKGHGHSVEPITYDQHTIAGYRLLRDLRLPASSSQIVLHHHQRWSGGGWPAVSAVTGKNHEGPQSQDDIHIFTRIVSAANVLDNLMCGEGDTRRPAAMALHEFASHRFDGWFDPVIRRAFLRRIPPFGVGSMVSLSDGRDAVVTARNAKDPCRPAVRTLDGSPLLRRTLHAHPARDQFIPATMHIVKHAGIDVERWIYDLPDAVPMAA